MVGRWGLKHSAGGLSCPVRITGCRLQNVLFTAGVASGYTQPDNIRRRPGKARSNSLTETVQFLTQHGKRRNDRGKGCEFTIDIGRVRALDDETGKLPP